MKQVITLLSFLLPLYGFSQSVSSVTLYSVEDAGTRSGALFGGNNMGSNTTMDVAKYVAGVGRSFVKFDLSSIPSDAVIVSAVLRLTPSGTENVTATNSKQLYLDVCNTLWTESTITYSTGISNNTLYPTVDTSNLVSAKREFIVKGHLQAMVEGRLPNYGWRIRRSDETTTNATSTYFTREDATSSNQPQLYVQYYRRSYVSAATIIHNSSVSGNGSISPTVQYGSSSTKTFRWYNASGTQVGTAQNLTGRTSGWYGLKYWGTTAGDTTYQAFLIGSECEETAITFDPGPNYIDDSRITSLATGGGTTIISYRSMNYPTDNLTADYWVSGSDKYESRSLLRFRLWVDPNLQVNSASMTLMGNGHNPLEKTNESEFDRLTANWYETSVGWNNPLTFSSTEKILVTGLPAGNSNLTTDLSAFFNAWKADNTQNYGMLFRLQNLEDSYSRMQFYSSDATTATNRPKIEFKVSKTLNCDFTSYARFKDVLDGAFVNTFQGKLKIQVTEDYDQKVGQSAKLILYDASNNQIKAGINSNGTVVATGIPLLPSRLLDLDYNQFLLDLTSYSLTTGKYYVLEQTNSIGEKTYIKFKYIN